MDLWLQNSLAALESHLPLTRNPHHTRKQHINHLACNSSYWWTTIQRFLPEAVSSIFVRFIWRVELIHSSSSPRDAPVMSSMSLVFDWDQKTQLTFYRRIALFLTRSFSRVMSNKSVIQYYIPEDGDDMDHPNVYSIDKKSTTITVTDIRNVNYHSWILFCSHFQFLETITFGSNVLSRKHGVWFDPSS